MCRQQVLGVRLLPKRGGLVPATPRGSEQPGQAVAIASLRRGFPVGAPRHMGPPALPTDTPPPAKAQNEPRLIAE